MKEMLKGVTIYSKVDAKLFNILRHIFKHIGKENPIKIGDIVAMDEYGCRESSYDEIKEIPEERIIQRATKIGGFEGIVVKNEREK